MAGTGRFTHMNESFDCEACGREVPPAATGCRNHCPYCLSSKHVDVYPGDRANSCLGLLRPIGYELQSKKGIMIIFECQRCGVRTRNKAMRSGDVQDDYDAILKLASSVP